MSSDNGIYILKTGRFCGRSAITGAGRPHFEYRVIHAQAIENIYWDHEKGAEREDGRFTPEIAFDYFGEAPLFYVDSNAMDYARKLEEDHSFLEYGICSLDHGNQVFQTFSSEEMESFDARGDEITSQRHEEREAQRQVKLKAAAIPFHCGERFEPGAIYGYLVREDGTKVHGSLSGIHLLEVVGTTETGDETFEAILEGDGDSPHFLPSTWDKE